MALLVLDCQESQDTKVHQVISVPMVQPVLLALLVSVVLKAPTD
jgi:hypothetical protein